MNKIKILESKDKVINIIFNLTYKCNFTCYYCFAGERNEKTFVFEESSKNKIKHFLDSIYMLYPDVKIDFLLTGGEPLINKDFTKIVEFLLSFINLSITVTTNGFFLGVLKNNISIFSNNNFLFLITYHYYEYNKIKNSLDLFINNIKLLKKNNIKIKLNFLMPSEISEFKDFKNKKELIIKETNLSKDEYELNLIQENGVISTKYNNELLDYYDKYKGNKLLGEKTNIVLTLFDGTLLNINYIKELVEKGYCNFKGYLCYPFTTPTTIMLNHDISVIFAGCKTLSNSIYSIDQSIELMSKGNNHKVICNNNYCTCISNLLIKKEYNSNISEKIDKLNKYIIGKISKLLIIEGLEFIDFEILLNEKKGFLITYKSNKDNIFIKIFIEQKEANHEYMKIFGNFGTHYYKTNYQGGIINEKVEGIDDDVNKFLLMIKKIIPILEKIPI